jgi:hypothetical protein
VTGRDIIAFLQRELRKGVAEAAFDEHLLSHFNAEDLRCRDRYTENGRVTWLPNIGRPRDKTSFWWREALGAQHEQAGLCMCGAGGCGICRCPMGCVLDADAKPLEPKRIAMSNEC